MDTKGLERNIKQIIATGSGYGVEFKPVLKRTKAVLKKINHGRATADNFFILGELCIALEDTVLALEAFKTGYSINPNHLNCGSYYALLLEQHNHLDQALNIYSELNKIAPDNMMLVERMLMIYLEHKDYTQVLKICQHFLSKGINDAVIYEYISKVFFDFGLKTKAIKYLEQALMLDQDNDQYKQKLIVFYYHNEDYEQVLDFSDYVDNSESVPLFISLLVANSLANTGKLIEARQYFVNLLALNKEKHQILVEIALFHENFEHNVKKSIFVNQYILKREPANIHALSNLALHDSNSNALMAYKKVFLQYPNNPLIKLNYGHTLITNGQFEQGFDLYESRSAIHMKFLHNRLNYPASINDKNIFIWKEQGIGDEIIWAWFFQYLKHSNTKATVQVDKRLLELMTRSFPSINFIDKEILDTLETENFEKYDGKILLASLGKYYHNNISLAQDNYEKDLYKKSYLKVDEDKVVYWKNKLKNLTARKTVGICWRSGLKTKLRFVHYLTTEQIVEVFSDLDYCLVNVQYDYTQDELDVLSSALGDRFIHFPEMDLKNDQDNLAALLKSLDLIFSAQTAVNNLAGAVGVNTLCYSYIAKNNSYISFGKSYNIIFPTVKFLGFKDKLVSECVTEYKNEVTQILTN